MAKGFHNMVGGGKHENRNANDSYPTPPFATFALKRLVPDLEIDVLEPCAGRGWMARELERMGHNVLASDKFTYDEPLTDVVYGVDFEDVALDYQLKFGGRNFALVTNPPFNHDFPQRMIERAVATPSINTVAILQRLTFMESKKRYRLFTETPPYLVAPFDTRFSCDEKLFVKKPIGGMVAYAWYVWRKGETETRMHWIDGTQTLTDWATETKNEEILQDFRRKQR